VPDKSSVITEEMLKRGIIVRDCSKFVGCRENHIRVSIGKKSENDEFISKFKEVV
jgi:histidinol-phosphate aminotransferase